MSAVDRRFVVIVMETLIVRHQRIILATLSVAWVGLLLACGGEGTSSSKVEKSGKPVAPAAEKKWPYQFVESKTEQTGHSNVMDLYAFDGNFDPTDLKAFCKERKEKSAAKVFYYVVIFDTAANAKFPSAPFTAEYGDEEGALKHVRAIYSFNKLYGVSELRYHSQNIWEHIPTREKI